MVASYDRDDDGTWKDACGLVYGDTTSWKGAINLSCFKFPMDKEPAYQVAAGYILPQKMPVMFQSNGLYAPAPKPVAKPAPPPAKPPKVAVPAAPVAATTVQAKDVHTYYRNRLEDVLIKRSQDICTIEKGRIFANEATTNAGLGIMTTGLSTISSIVTGDLAKSILSGGAAFTSSSRDHLNANIWKNQLTTAITNAIDVKRAEILGKMSGNRAKSIYEYNVDEMIRTVNEYHQACSFGTGLQSLMTASANQERFTMMNENYQLQAKINSLSTSIEILRAAKADATTIAPLEARLGELILQAAETPESTAPAS
ncbi:hypothetical protein CHN51_12420 [Sphingorhabdus sp. YGSMI21]|nr:hypothetical protein CHN51_12420 [Sphingorhabdus sp. YGSMI21]